MTIMHDACMMMTILQDVAEDSHRCCVMTILQDDVHVVEDGHRCCVMTIIHDVHVAEDGQ